MTSNRNERMTVPSIDQMRGAIAARDGSYDGVFYYGVVTTGVYCRPSCAARPARPENLRFFPDPASAEGAGFRACKRCKPGELDRERLVLIETAGYIATHADERLTLDALSKRAGLSSSRFQKAFKNLLGVSPKAFQDAVRLDRFKDSLKAGKDVTSAIFEAGFGSASRVYGEAARTMGMTPAAYRSGGKGEEIHYACRSTSLGPLMMAATGRGVCFAQFGDSERALLDQLRDEFRQAKLVASPAGEGDLLDEWITALDRYLSKDAPRPDVPLDLRGTAFQLKVWRFLLGLGEGDVVSYGELANEIGKPAAVRAAASACGANRVGVLVPCHRVLRGDGSLGGYRWGLDRKRTLLDLERANRSQD